ncbi:unnamed protein product [Pedinophyceae sp. YPF-701]|nr:unnamed protein product [Pedinophyceae sp. YPF-701]
MVGRATLLLVLGLLGLSHIGPALAEVYFEEKFDATWQQRWKTSSWKQSSGEAGEWALSHGSWYGDKEADLGISTSQDARFYTLYSKMPKPFTNKGKDLVLQFSVKHEQDIDCGGGYIKLLPSSVTESEMKDFSGDTTYSIMFGPDICGLSTRRVHTIFGHRGENKLIKREVSPVVDTLTHVYTLIVRPDNTYSILIDNEEKQTGALEDDWAFLEPKEIEDASATKPDDWDERAMIEDPEDKKPDGWDDIPKEIPDESAEKPEDWDDDEDGEWEAPMVPNPEYKGEWKPKMISNPNFKGVWTRPKIPNPKYKPDDKLYELPELGWVGFELWQVKAGSIFDNILVTDDAAYAKKFADETFLASGAAAEKEMKEKAGSGPVGVDATTAADEEEESDDDGEEEHDEL